MAKAFAEIQQEASSPKQVTAADFAKWRAKEGISPDEDVPLEAMLGDGAQMTGDPEWDGFTLYEQDPARR